MLHTSAVDAGYGDMEVLYDVSLDVSEGELLSIIGPNGAGKTTIMRTLMGIISPTSGSVTFRDRDITTVSTPDRVEMGMSLVPEGRHLFRDMSVRENLILGQYLNRDADKQELLDRVYATFPRLEERKGQRADTLSGGEAQMLTIGRGLMSEPDLLLLDEPSVGLAPNLVTELFERIERINEDGVTIVMVEQNVNEALEVADRGALLENGRITMTGDATEFLDDDRIVERYLGGGA
ncbi:ABC transporter ATP-binding protein [Halorarum halobium]|uniref:ABC transporter ATP-binding protein n=1 Tax=Halorarum halobium TaxID=3075121 RepID=UPI0028B1BB8B|nr:ABC transporter ATP-binding protein [Halobaculum sp. XH14]